MSKKFMFPLDLQLFAEPTPPTEPTPPAEPTPPTEPTPPAEPTPPPLGEERVQQLMSEAIANARKEWEQELTEAKKLEGMTEAQRKAHNASKKETELAEREARIVAQELRATASVELSKRGLPLALVDNLVFTDAEACKASIESVEKAFQEAVTAEVDSRIQGGKPLKKVQGPTGGLSLEDIRGMSPTEINARWDEVQEAMKNQ